MTATTTLPVLFATGIHASRPSASAVGAGGLYSCTTHSLVYQTDGVSTWSTWATLGAVASGSITASGYTQSTAKMLGRSTASTGAIEEITVGTGLSLSGGSLSASGGGTDPWYMEGSLLFPTGNTNWTTINLDAGEINAHDMESSGAQNDEIYWDLGISGGTWDFQLLHLEGSNRGIYTVSIDGSSIGTIDGYNAGAVKNVRSTITSASITGGKRRLKLKMATKNGSSSNYFGTATAWFLRRTA